MSTEIVDLRGYTNVVDDLAKQVLDGLSRPVGERELPTVLLYDQRGLRLYDEITTKAPEYYLFGAEEEILTSHAGDIVKLMQPDVTAPAGVMLELGAGSLRKTSHILRCLSHLVPTSSNPAPITYYALDLEESELRRTLGEIVVSDFGKDLPGKIEIKGLCGTFSDGIEFARKGGCTNQYRESKFDLDALVDRVSGATRSSSLSSTPSENRSDDEEGPNSTAASSPPSSESLEPPLHIMFLGSSIGNFNREDAAGFIRSLPLRPGSADTLLLGLDHDNEKELIEEAYNDPNGHTEKFIMNGLKVAGRAVGAENLFDESKWDYVNLYNVTERCHEAYFRSKCRQVIVDKSMGNEFVFLENERLKIEQSYKYSDEDAYSLFSDGNVRPIHRWSDKNSRYSLWLLERPTFIFPLLKSPFSCTRKGELVRKTPISSIPFGIPSREDWDNVWALWDTVSLQMIPPSMLSQKPIDLRHICLFYLGHIPTFLDIHLTSLLQEKPTEPEYFQNVFERGIDPHVDDRTVAHSHSEVPQRDEDWPQLSTVLQFQSRVRARLLKLYDDLLSGRKPMTRRIGRVLFMTYEHEGMHAETLLYMLLQRAGTGTLPPQGFRIPQWEIVAKGWETIPPPYSERVELGPEEVLLGHDDIENEDFQSDSVDHEFGWDNESPQRKVLVGKFAIEWRPITNGQFYQFYIGEGKECVDFPASWVMENGETKVRTLYGPVPMKIAEHWPVMTTYNNLSTYATVKGGRIPTEPELRLFYDKFESGYEGGSNYGFRIWHPVPATTGGKKNGGRGGNGGVWEWTSTLLDNFEGFSPSVLYPGYSMDFFDGDHQIVLGGSYATIPRLAGRRTVRNWYQGNYPYAWIGARIAYDI
ncbi:DUF323 domain containing protein [Amanita muscaria]